jgi:hypothetical protein
VTDLGSIPPPSSPGNNKTIMKLTITFIEILSTNTILYGQVLRYATVAEYRISSIDNMRVIYTKNSKLVKNEHAQYTFESYEK